MQHKRQEIINVLKQRGNASVDELSKELGITTVTVRHHLDVLRSEGLVSEPAVRHRSSSGRPQHIFSLTPKAEELFPRNYDGLAQVLLDEVKSRLDTREVNVIFEGVVHRLLADAPRPSPDEPIEQRLDRAINFLNEKGYVAHWERRPDGFFVQTRNCPFEALAGKNPELCSMDLILLTSLMGITLQRVCHMPDGDNSCAYMVKEVAVETR
ncbi:MAG: ArsR family transcriptional regulator [Chloroflexi bacterium]|nr:ArsR family transcriptional regulator [Chloroflexota bacterium]